VICLMLLSVLLLSPLPSKSCSAGWGLGSPAAFSSLLASSLYPGKASQAANPAEPLHLEIKAPRGTVRVSLHLVDSQGTDRDSLGEAGITTLEGGS
jgi:hypothetical protein